VQSQFFRITTRNKLDGYVYCVNLRGKRFFEIANQPEASSGSNMLDSGKRETFETGAVRDTAEGKPRFDLFSPFAMERIGCWLEQGARKYKPRNWELGMNYMPGRIKFTSALDDVHAPAGGGRRNPQESQRNSLMTWTISKRWETVRFRLPPQ
jgi:hypothetical protein